MVNVTDLSTLEAIVVLHYENSTTNPTGPIPSGPDPFDMDFSVNQEKSIMWNLTAGASRPNPQGTFNHLLKLADYVNNGTGVFELDKFPIYADNPSAVNGTFVQSGTYKGWVEIVFTNELQVLDSWHLEGFGFYVVGFGTGKWNPGLPSTYNLFDHVVRSTVQHVYPGGWTPSRTICCKCFVADHRHSFALVVDSLREFWEVP
ncbi:hypothetical protein POM88_013423 [Heracleum sosnowskyi]|uniref:Plastocyanin-like domain-containing protein n=1 Tax=Heracleum sosnowskyi TaxID=360622 RepID=A0AAD8N3B3_9APIA|nr:hypothetical protein POM88_013423 [Heracleum sosnowskyi]